MRKVGIIALVLILSIAMAGFAGGGRAAGGDQVVKLGLSTPMTGTGTAAGAWISSGFQMAADEINAQGGILGHRVEVIVMDDAGNPAQANTVINRLYFQENVLAVFGPNMSNAIVGVHAIAQQARRPMIVGGTAPSFGFDRVGNPYLFRIRPDDNVRVVQLVRYLVETMGARRPGIIVGTTEYCLGGLEVALEAFQSHNIPIIIQEQIREGDVDATGQITRMRAANIDVVVGLTHEPEAATFVTQARGLGLNVPMAGFSAWAGPMFTDVAGDAATGVYAIQFWHPDLADARGQEWARRFEAQYRMPASEHAVSYYDALFFFKAVAERAGSFDVDRLLQAMREVDFQGINRLRLDPKHNLSNTVFMTRWNGNSYDMIARIE